MPYRQLCCVFAALWALSSAPVFGQTQFFWASSTIGDSNALREKLETAAKGERCNPFIDPGCNTPTGGDEPGCTDCVIWDVAPLLRSDGLILNLDSIEIENEDKIIIRRELTPQYLDSIKMGPQVGY